MKGFYIFEAETHKEAVVCLELANIVQSHSRTFSPGTITEEIKMHALVSKGTKTKCSPDDTYDFETGALIALMKKCGVDKVVRACNEAFSEDTFKTYATMYERELNDLSKKYDKVVKYCDTLRESNKRLQKEKEQIIVAKNILYNKLEKENKDLKKNIDELFESEQHSKSELGRLYFEKHRLEEKVEKLQHEYDLCLNSENALKITTQMQNKSIEKLTKAIDGYKNDLYKVSKRCTELEAKEAILNKQEETINKKEEELSVYFGGRQNGKQYTFLVELFKKIDQKKVDAAYKEAYNTELPVWQKEFFKQMYDITVYRKTEPIKHNDQLDSLLEAAKYTIPSEFTFKIDQVKPLTKREEMWENIKNGKINTIKVEKPFINDFLSEAEDNGLVWANGGEKPTEWDRWENWRRHDYIVFKIWNFPPRKELTWGANPNEKTIDYLPPMRWDLFKKGRLAVKVDYDNYKEFYEACEKELGRRPVTAVFTEDFTVSICKKDGLFEIFTIEDQKETGRKIVDWEDVR